MAEDPKWELALLATVQGFYQRLMSDHLGGEIPEPAELTPQAIGHTDDVRATLQRMKVWIQLLDMAVTPAILRLGMPSTLDPEVAEALLRYFARHRDDSASNRDKTDLVATFLFRHPRVPGQWERSGYGLDGSLPLSPFEIALLEILSESDAPVLPEEHVQKLREFGPLLDETKHFEDFNELMDSGIIQRVRDLKASLGDSFYHPGVLATLAPYNAAFGDRFDQLFAAATNEIKDFARRLEELGGSILSTVDGVEVTVEHVSALNEADLLKLDYAAALDKFRRVSKLRKELERRPPLRRAPQPATAHSVGAGGAAAAPARAPKFVPPAITPQVLSIEEAKLRRVEESIRIFVRVADPKFRQIVPMRYFNLMLTLEEVEAYTADYLEEASRRAEAGRMLLRIVAVTARITTELEELKRSQNSPSIWKLHADSLVVLIDLARRLTEAAESLALQLAQDSDMHSRGESLRGSLAKLQERTDQVAKILGES
ncbi:MAG TPA: hypothetical protein VLT90_03260 [Terriglobales bacterium]|nr:hypothetical protein [Terriglobales bacterium]